MVERLGSIVGSDVSGVSACALEPSSRREEWALAGVDDVTQGEVAGDATDRVAPAPEIGVENALVWVGIILLFKETFTYE